MAVIRPFRALRPLPEKAREVASVPYDVVETEEARALAQGNPLSFLHVIRPEIDLPEGTDLYSEPVYRKAEENLSGFRREGVLIEEAEPCLYIYRLKMGDHEQVGIGACCSVNEYDSDTIRKHEHTRREKEDDRLKHMLTLSAHTGPVLLTYRSMDRIDTLVGKEMSAPPLYDFTAPDGIGHTLWRVTETTDLAEAFGEVPLLYIADGHHRAAGASRVKQEMRKRQSRIEGWEEFNFFLGVLFPSDQLRIFSYNRYVSDLGKHSGEDFLQKVREHFKVVEEGVSEPRRKGQFCMYLDGKWRLLELRPELASEPKDPVSALDLSLFQVHLLEPMLGIMDQKKDKRIDFIGGPGSASKLEERVKKGGGVAFTFFPVRVEELLAVADAGKIMPPKSTWFAPKLRSGLLVHLF